MLKTELNDFAERYLTLGLRINKHINGYVEHYYGPPEIKKKVDLEEKISPKVLLDDFYYLEKKLDKQNYESNRLKFFNKTFTAIETILKKLNNYKISYLELIEKLFDFTPKLYDEKTFYDLSLKAKEAYKGIGVLPKRIQNYAKKRKVPITQLKPLFEKALHIAREKTVEKFPKLLPEKDNFKVNLVNDKSWTMYNWYLGEYKSRIDINVDIAQFWTNLLIFACHEGYPGHHTDRCIKDFLFYRNQGHFENCISLIYTPEFAIYEGMGELAENVIFDIKEIAIISKEVFCPNSKDEDRIETLTEQYQIKRGIKNLKQNLAYYKHINGWKDKDLIKYCNDFKLFSKSSIEATLNFISNEIWATYVLAYQGERIIREKFGDPPTLKSFRELLSHKYLPSDLI
jgi:hypothetical protein